MSISKHILEPSSAAAAYGAKHQARLPTQQPCIISQSDEAAQGELMPVVDCCCCHSSSS
jgi:hypothetical protein